MGILKRSLFAFAAILVFPLIAFAATSFPALTGMVVDNAHLLPAPKISSLEQILTQYEKNTSNQLVVVTTDSLQGLTIEEYGYQLGRYWGIGQKGKNNGVLLIVAHKDRQVRIEVGYGLEGKLTDAVSSQIIQTIILPRFRDKDYVRGIDDGVTAIITVLSGKQLTVSDAAQDDNIFAIIFILVFVVLFILVQIYGKGRGGGNGGGFIGGGGFGRGGSGFRGGGGGFGGGGSTGRW